MHTHTHTHTLPHVSLGSSSRYKASWRDSVFIEYYFNGAWGDKCVCLCEYA